jgi:hypothetical protein
MAKDRGHVMLVGRVAHPENGWGVEEVFRKYAVQHS